MLMEYTDKYYLPALGNAKRLKAGEYEAAKSVAKFLDLVRHEWYAVAVDEVRTTAKPVMERGDPVTVEARVRMGALGPDQVQVELYHGSLSSTGAIVDPVRVEMKAGALKGGAYDYSVQIRCEKTGQLGYAVRVLPKHPDLVHPFLPGLVRWA